MTAKLSFVSVAALAALPMTFACGGDDGAAHPVTHDASMGSNMVDAPAPCLANDTYAPTFAGSDDQFADDYPAEGSGSDATRHVMFYTGYLNQDPLPDALYLDLWQGYGGFGSGDIKTGQYVISGEDAAYSTCGICAYLAADVDPDNGPADYYFAQSGVVNITSITTNLTGTLQNVNFARVGIDPETGDPSDTAVGDCQSTIASASFSGPIEVQTGSGSAATGKIRVRVTPNRVLHHRYM
ncbi:MAG: hypothetical protein HOV81_23810 [Kofleriaceae bacterium]|nr:hypothetical protein [Kofleriaceae bacterium]